MATWIGAISGLLAVGVGVFALTYANKQIKLASDQRKDASNVARGQFLLQLDEALQTHQVAHFNLRPGGEWYGTADRPTDAEMAIAIAYMGFFERIKIMIDQGLLEAKIINRLYGYRVGNIWANDRLMREKLVKLSSQWQDFLGLVKCMEKVRRKEYQPGRWNEYNQLLSKEDAS